MQHMIYHLMNITVSKKKEFVKADDGCDDGAW
jgi:hypothetical protein